MKLIPENGTFLFSVDRVKNNKEEYCNTNNKSKFILIRKINYILER